MRNKKMHVQAKAMDIRVKEWIKLLGRLGFTQTGDAIAFLPLTALL